MISYGFLFIFFLVLGCVAVTGIVNVLCGSVWLVG